MVNRDAKSAWDVEVDGEFKNWMFIGSGPFSQKSLKIAGDDAGDSVSSERESQYSVRLPFSCFFLFSGF